MKKLAYFLDTPFQRFLRNTSWLFASNLTASLLNFAQSILLARWLGVENFGILSLVIANVTLIFGFIDFRVWETTTRYVTKFWEEKDHTRAQAVIRLSFLVDGLTGVIAFVVLVLIAPLVAEFLINKVDSSIYIRLYAIAMLCATLNSTSMSILRVFDKFAWLALNTMAAALLKLLMLFGLYLSDEVRLTTVIGMTIVGELLTGFSLLALTLKTVSDKFPPRSKRGSIALLWIYRKELLHFQLNTSTTAFLQTLGSQLDMLLLGYFSAPIQVGYYKIAKNFVAMIARIGQPFFEAVYPELVRLWSAKDYIRFRKMVRKTTIIMTIIICPLCVILATIVPELITYTAGTSYLPATNAIRIMIIGIGVNFILLWQHPVALAVGRARATNVALLCQVPIWIFGALFLIPTLGYIGAAIMYTTATLVWVSVLFFQIRDIIWQSTPSGEIRTNAL